MTGNLESNEFDMNIEIKMKILKERYNVPLMK